MTKPPAHLTSPSSAEASRQQLEDELFAVVWPYVRRFLLSVQKDAQEALDAPVMLTAAANPMAFTNIKGRWMQVVRDLAALSGDPSVGVDLTAMVEELSASDLPELAYGECAEILQKARAEGWTNYRAKRHLSKLLIPKQKKDEERSRYRGRVVALARGGATRQHAIYTLGEFAAEGFASKSWVTCGDDRVRGSHAAADGQVVPLDDAFSVGGWPMMFPGDPTAPGSETYGCRCVMVGEDWTDPSGAGDDDYEDDYDYDHLTASGREEQHTMKRVGWEGPIGFESQLTGDGRLIEEGALVWDNLPVPLRYVSLDVGAHDGASAVGLIETLERRGDGAIWGAGFIDLRDEDGETAAHKVSTGVMNGVSMDLDAVSFEIRVKSEIMDEMRAIFEELEDEDGGAQQPASEVDEDGREVVARVSSDDEIMVTTSANVRAATLVAIPAFADARISLVGDPYEVEDAAPLEELDGELALVAAGGPLAPPLAWFESPRLEGPTPLTITPEGRIYGHLATWDTCHIAYDICTTAPTSATDYAYFHVGGLITKEGHEIGVGHITLGTGHARQDLNAVQALAHYDNTGSVVADIRVGEDQFGIWFSGGVRPGLTPEKLRDLRAAPLSGDWRGANGNLELVAALAVNVPGFPVPRPTGLVASGGRMVTLLTSSGVLPTSGRGDLAARVGRAGRRALSAADLDTSEIRGWIEGVARRALGAEQRQEQPSALAASAERLGSVELNAARARILRQRMISLRSGR